MLDRLQSGFLPPPGATVRGGAPPTDLDHALTAIGPGELLTTHRLWTVPGSPQAALAFLRAHLVQGTIQGDSGGSSGGLVPFWFDEDVAGTTLHGVVTPALIAGAGDTSILRVDFEVSYSPARPPDEAVTAADRYVSISRTAETFPTPSPARQVAFSDPATVVALANAFNGLIATSAGGMKCPIPPVGYTISFSASAMEPSGFVAQGPGCGGWYVSINGKKSGVLQQSDTLSRLLSSLVGP